ncbi:hypothetical protein JHK86_024307 [Glycine max]|nr:hypothetical protein JHK86_024307 [Glycine max]
MTANHETFNGIRLQIVYNDAKYELEKSEERSSSSLTHTLSQSKRLCRANAITEEIESSRGVQWCLPHLVNR